MAFGPRLFPFPTLSPAAALGVKTGTGCSHVPLGAPGVARCRGPSACFPAGPRPSAHDARPGPSPGPSALARAAPPPQRPRAVGGAGQAGAAPGAELSPSQQPPAARGYYPAPGRHPTPRRPRPCLRREPPCRHRAEPTAAASRHLLTRRPQGAGLGQGRALRTTLRCDVTKRRNAARSHRPAQHLPGC